MKFYLNALLVMLFMATPVLAISSQENEANNSLLLTPKQKAMVPIAAFTANGDLDRLTAALNEGLDAGLTINQIKEAMVHLYAYTGFPRSLNALNAFMKVLEDRKERGIEDVVGKESSPVPADLDKDKFGAEVRAMLAGRERDISGARWQEFSPVIDTFLKEHLFADIFARDVLTYQDRELVTIAALANLAGAGGQLFFHLGAAMNTGFSEAQMQDFVSVLSANVGKDEGTAAQKILDEVVKARK